MGAEALEAIPRSLEEGWHYRPNWRAKIVDIYLSQTQPGVDALEVLKEEHDSYIRQGYLYRRKAQCLHTGAFAYAHGCASNPASGAATLIKALAITKAPANEIAKMLRTATKNITVFLKLHFDITAYLDDRAWLASVIFPAGRPNTCDPATFRESHWLATAFIAGRPGIDRMLSRKANLTESERAELMDQIRSGLTTRAFEFVDSLRNGSIPSTPEDFERFIKMLDASARQPPPTNDPDKFKRFIRAIHGILGEKANSSDMVDEPALDLLRTKKAPEPEFSRS
jgi:hypothetical protein